MGYTIRPGAGDTSRSTSSVSAVALSLDGSTVASGSHDSTIKLWDTRLGYWQERATLQGHTLWVSAIAFSLDGLTVASGSGDLTIKLWDTQSGQERATLECGSVIQKLWFSANGSQLHTDRGVLEIPSVPAALSSGLSPPISPSCSSSPGLFVRDQWIHYGTERLFWLPPNYRPTKVAVYEGIVVLGFSSGRISFLEVDFKFC
jgi:WD40 repeat protein